MPYTKLYLTTSPQPYTPATVRGAWNDTTSHIPAFLDWIKDGGGRITSVTLGETSLTTPYARLMYRGVSGPLAAQTFGGTVDVRISVDTSSTAADMFWFLHLYVTQGNSDVVRGDLLTNYGESTNEMPSSGDLGDTLASPQSLAALAVSDGDRLVAEMGFIARNVVATNYTLQFYYGTQTPAGANAGDQTAGGAATLASHLVFSQAINEFTTASPNRVSQALAEISSKGADQARLSQVLVEIATGATSAQRLSQMLAEIATGTVSPQALSQIVVELATVSPVVVPEFTPSTWMGDGMGEIWIE